MVFQNLTLTMDKKINVEKFGLGDYETFGVFLLIKKMVTFTMVMSFEEEFDLEIPEDDAEKIQTIGDAIGYLKERTGS